MKKAVLLLLLLVSVLAMSLFAVGCDKNSDPSHGHLHHIQ